jgi:hypothetical protein
MPQKWRWAFPKPLKKIILEVPGSFLYTNKNILDSRK